MYDTRFSRDDLVPMLKDDGVAATLAPWLRSNASEEFLRELIQIEHSVVLLTGQLRQLIADLAAGGFLPGAGVTGLPAAVTVTPAPSGLGCSGVNGTVWVTAPGETYVLRFYVNGVYKLTLTNYNSTDPATLGASSGDVVQVCQVVDGVPGWWARITVP